MKRFKHIFSAILAVILINLTTEVAAQDFSRDKDSDISVQNSRVNEEATAWLDSVDISLLTCGPGQEVWSYYGHTALRIQNKAMGTDVAVTGVCSVLTKVALYSVLFSDLPIIRLVSTR